MLKDEWLEYFELVNGRKPSPKEFKEALDREEFILFDEGVRKSGESQTKTSEVNSNPSTSEELTATARALAQAQSASQGNLEASDSVSEDGRVQSQELEESIKTLQSGRQLATRQEEERQRQQMEETKARLATYAPTRPADGRGEFRDAIPVFSNKDHAVAQPEEASNVDKKLAKEQKKADIRAAKAKAKEEKQVAKLEKRLMRQLDILQKVQGLNQPKNNRGKGTLVASMVALFLMLVIGGAYGFWRNASGDIKGIWELKSSQVMDKDSGQLKDALTEYKDKGEVYRAYLEVDDQNQLIAHSYSYPEQDKSQPTFTASDYLKSHQMVDQWNKAITYTMEDSDFKKDLSAVVEDLYPNADKKLVDYYISDNVDNYKLYRKGERTKTYTIDHKELVISTYNEDGKLTSRDTYRKASPSESQKLTKDYEEARATYEKNRKEARQE